MHQRRQRRGGAFEWPRRRRARSRLRVGSVVVVVARRLGPFPARCGDDDASLDVAVEAGGGGGGGRLTVRLFAHAAAAHFGLYGPHLYVA